jgi:NADH dehydrogenase FAD-containing subunit
MALEGARVHAVCEIMPYPGGLSRNIAQCLEDFGIPLKLSHTVTRIHGMKRVIGVTVARVDKAGRPDLTTEEYIPCDTLLLSVGLIPENELSRAAGARLDGATGGTVVNQYRETTQEGIFACGNALHVHDLADFASEEAEIAGRAAADYIKGKRFGGERIDIIPRNGIRYTVPQSIEAIRGDVKLYFRVKDIVQNVVIKIARNGQILLEKKKARLAPGEMEYVVLKRASLENSPPGEIVVGLEAVL